MGKLAKNLLKFRNVPFKVVESPVTPSGKLVQILEMKNVLIITKAVPGYLFVGSTPSNSL